MPTIADTLADWAASLQFEAVPESVVKCAKRCLVDVIGVAIAGSSRRVPAMVFEVVRAEYAPGACTVLGAGGDRFSAPGAAFANAASAHVLDFDDTCYDGIVHGSAAVWPAATAAAESIGASGKDFLTAFIAGVEIEYALGRVLTDHLYHKGWWNSGVLGCVGAAAGAARALSLDLEATRQAIRTAICQATGPRVLLGTPLKPWALGRAAEAGVMAAFFAGKGLTGPDSALEHERGVIRLFNDGVFQPDALSDLGSRFSLETPGVAFKLYPICSAAQAATEVTLQMLTELRIPAEKVKSVHCDVTPLVAECLVYNDPETEVQAQFSMPFAIGCALAFGSLGIEHLNQETLSDGRLREAMRKVTMASCEDLAATEDARRNYPEGAIITILNDEGDSVRKYNGAATGLPVKPMADDLLDGKFFSCAQTGLSPSAAAELLARIRSMESLPRISDLFAGLV
jgi:2-methylcitrate dehydratase PrpD